jgi:glutamate transport system substrate-binding protein
MLSRTRTRTLIALGLAGMIALSACGKEAKESEPQVTSSVQTDVSVAGSTTFAAMKARGKVVIGVKEDQPNLGYKDPTTGQYSGFDIEIARLVAAQLGFASDKIEYKAIPSANRETSISAGEIDYYVGTYSITDTRKQVVSFAGPYYIAGQDLMVRKDDTSITGQDSLAGKKICSVTGSTPAKRLKDKGLDVLELEKYSLCVDLLLNKQTDAVTTDDAILKGYAAQNPDKLKVVGKPFSEEKYGIGLNKDDAALRGKVNDIIEASRADGKWKQIYDSTLGKSGSSATQPTIERY